MKVLRSLLIGFLSFACALAVSTLIWLVALQATVLQRDLVKGWLRESDVYSKVIATTINQAPDIPANTLITPDATQKALQNTFTPDYVQNQAEKIIDNAYDWMDGKLPQLQFSVPIDEKRTAFIEQLAATLEPQVAALPVCTNRADAQAGTCRPPTQTPAQYAQTVATQAVAQSDVLARPITDQSLTTAPQNQSGPSELELLQKLPAITQTINWLVIALPIIAVLSAGLIALFAEDRLLALKRLGRRICMGSIFTLIAALVLLYFSGGNTLPNIVSTASNPLAELLAPFFQKAIGALAQWLIGLSAIAIAISGGAWLACGLLVRKRQHSTLPPTTPPAPQPPHTPPTHRTTE